MDLLSLIGRDSALSFRRYSYSRRIFEKHYTRILGFGNQWGGHNWPGSIQRVFQARSPVLHE